MGFFQACKDFLGIDSVEEGFDGYYEEGYEEPQRTFDMEEDEPLMDSRAFLNSRRVSKKADKFAERTSSKTYANSNGLKVVLCNPTEFDNCPMICDHLRSQMTVVLNLENVKSATEKRRIFDFVSGCCFALDCNIKKISEPVYVVAPAAVDLLAEADLQEEAKDPSKYFASDYDL